MRKLNAVDLFAGCGGITDGFERTGFYRTVACVEWEKEPCRTLARRLREKWGYADAERRVLRFDIQKTKELLNGWKNDSVYGASEGLLSLVEEAGQTDVIIGGPPCQAYSLAGRIRDENGMQNDYRNYLFEGYVEVVKALTPAVFVFENVPGMLTASPGGVLITDRVRKAFGEVGYEIVSDIREHALFDLTDYGVPQKRQRVILVGLRRNLFKDKTQKALAEIYDEIIPALKADRQTVKDAIGDLPGFKPLPSATRENGRYVSHAALLRKTIPNHFPRFHSLRDISIFRELARDIRSGSNKYVSVEQIKKLYTEKTGKTSNIHKYYVLRENSPSNTIVSHLHKDGLRHIHPDPAQARSITVREAARLQTFDDDFVFTGSMGDQYKMVGNAVPPLFAEVLARAVAIVFERYLLRKEAACSSMKTSKK